MGITGEARLMAISWLKERIQACEEELAALKAILAALEGEPRNPRAARPGERSLDVRDGRNRKRRLGVLYEGEDYVRVAPYFEAFMPQELQSYLEEVVSEIRAIQKGEKAASLEVHGDGSVREIVIRNLDTPLAKVKARAALKHSLEVMWDFYRYSKKNGGARLPEP